MGKSIGVARLCWLLLGSHYLYFGRWLLQLVFWLTLGGLGAWWIVDLFRLPAMLRRHAARVEEKRDAAAAAARPTSYFTVKYAPGQSPDAVKPRAAVAGAPLQSAAVSPGVAQAEAGPPPMVDIAAPPVPARTTALRRPPMQVVWRRLGQLGLMLGAGAIFAFLVAGFLGPTVAVIFFMLVALVVLTAGLADALRGRLGICPFCGATLGSEVEATLRHRRRPEPVRCDKCNEYSTLENGVLRPHDPDFVAAKPVFRSPVYKHPRWPHGCVACGAPPTRFLALKSADVSMMALLGGVLRYSSGQVSGVPHCDAHDEGIKVEIDDKKLYFLWSSLPQMRRYLEANRTRINLFTQPL
ncbi:MAG: hypothetical protein HY246_01345 [Proteobacteria bacterium]|nr:hypothetical protein [Pseudomonadota bacterium]